MDYNQVQKLLEKSDSKTLINIRKAITRILLKRKEEDAPLSKAKAKNFQSKRYNQILNDLMFEDWSYLFESYSDDPADYYVYMHGDPRHKKRYTMLEVMTFGFPFYVGMGQGGRAYTFKRSPAHMAELRRMKNQGFDKEEIVFIVADGLSEREARELESKLILFYGVQSFKNKNNDQRKDAFNQKRSLLNNQYEPMPEKYHHLM